MPFPIHRLFPPFLYNLYDNSFLATALLPLIQLLALTAPPFKYRNLIFSAAILALAPPTLFHRTFDSTSLQYSVAGMWLYYLGTVSKLLFSEPRPAAAFCRI